MKKVLYITANPKVESKSFSLQVGRAFIEEYKKNNPQDEVVEIDVYNANVPLIDADILNAWEKLGSGASFDSLTAAESEKVVRFGSFTDQFVNADKYVFVTPFWNLSVPPMLKAYVDTFCVAGKAFKYTENGPVGLLGDKKAVHIQAAGGVYSDGPAKAVEHGNSYLTTILGFTGVQDIQSILVEGMAYAPEKAEEIKNAAIVKAVDAAKKF